MSFIKQKSTLALSLVLLSLFVFTSNESKGQCSSIIDLNTWAQEGPAGNGNWVVNAAGTQVTQTINGQPTFFVSPQNFINVRMTGTIVTTGSDDDFIGFVFGYRDPFGGAGPTYPIETWLFDWKRGNQTVGGVFVEQGRYLSQINGTFDLTGGAVFNATFWGHQSQGGFNLVQSATGAGTGWAVGTTYNFELTYLADRTTIVVNNDTFFDVAGCFEPGRFGFYNYSQNPVVYSNFSYTLLPNFSMSGNNICLTDTALFSYTQDTCSSALLVNSVIESWDWDFGDGNTDTVINPNHQYASTGTYTVQLVVTDSVGCQDSLSQQITVDPVPATPQASNSGPVCEGSPLALTGTAPINLIFSWTGPNGYANANASPTINPAAPADSGPYILTVSDGNCSSLPDTTLAVVIPLPAAPLAGSNSPICEDSTLQLTANGSPAGTYAWTGPNGFASALQNPSLPNAGPAASGSYSVTATLNGCTGPPATVSVIVNPTPQVGIAGDSVICFGDATTLTASGASTYLWSNGPATGSQTLSPANTTSYSVVGTSAAGCPAPPVPVTVTVNALPVVGLGADTIVCDSLVLDAGAGFSDYAWSTGASSQSITVLVSGSYQVTVMNADSCFAADTVNVTVNYTPVASIAGDSTICPGGSTTLTASGGGTYAWNNGGSGSTITVAPAADSTYAVIATSNGCSSLPDSITVLVGSIPLVNLGPDTTVCDQLTLDAGPGLVDYLWNTAATTQTILVSSSGVYDVTVMNIDSCFSSDTIAVTVNNTIPVDLGPDQDICPGAAATLVASPGGFSSYNWSTLQNTASISVSTAGNYSVSVTDINGCPSSDAVFVNVFPLLSGDLGPNTIICNDSSIVLDASGFGGAAYAWQPGGQSSPSITVSSAGQYLVVVDDGNGCLYRDSISISVDVPPSMGLTASLSTQCQWDPVVFTASPSGLSSYIFSDNGAPQQSGASPVFGTAGLLPGNNVTVVGITAAGCPTLPSAAAPVTMLPRPTGIAAAGTVCEGDATLLSVSTPGGIAATWTGAGGLAGNGPSLSHVYPASGAYNYSIVLDNGVCDTTLIGLVNVLPLPAPPLIADRSACEGTDISLNPAGLGDFVWYDAPVGGNVVGSGTSYFIPGASVSDTLYVETTVSTGCTSPREEVIVSIFPEPTADFLTNPDSSALLNIPSADLELVNLSAGATSYLWDFGDGNFSDEFAPGHSYESPGMYSVTLVAFSGEGCSDTLSRGIYEVVNEHPVYIPNAFTPNGDDLNEFFEIVTFGIESYDLDVFDRWGKLIFSNGGSMDVLWDGSVGGQPGPEGVYVYRLRAYRSDGEEQDYKGTVTLLR